MYLSFHKKNFSQTFSRAQIAALVASGVDYGILFGMTEFLHCWYVTATAVGAGIGAWINFMINRHWSFEAADGKLRRQAWRYGLVSVGSLLLNALGVYILTEYGHLYYGYSVGWVALGVAVFYNYPLHHWYVYR